MNGWKNGRNVSLGVFHVSLLGVLSKFDHGMAHKEPENERMHVIECGSPTVFCMLLCVCSFDFFYCFSRKWVK